MKRIALVLLGLSLIACNKKEDAKPGAPPSPSVQLPIDPVCTTTLYTKNGTIGNPSRTPWVVVIPNFDLAKGDHADFTYRRSYTTGGWATYREGFYSALVFTISGSTVTITPEYTSPYDWAIAATIHECH